MAFRDISLSIKSNLRAAGSSLQDPRTYTQYIRYALLGIAFVALGILAFVGHGWYVASRERAAEKDLSAYVAQYYGALNSAEVQWGQVASLFEVGYLQHTSSLLAPYFLAYQADALLQEGNTQKALEVMQQMLDKLPESSPFYALFRMKYNLIILDQPEHPEHQAALIALHEIGSDKTNAIFEAALFYLGRYHFVHNNVQEAKEIWQELRATAVDENPSAFVQEAEEYLELVG
jgi:tetratricopeptide (TPR) repeat protein